ncbi:MAG: hypothetical protein COU52_00480, partial [Candidatus Omnitrophica bacterium CG10_big_fil_rev_8_21_14_0_10_43_8]
MLISRLISSALMFSFIALTVFVFPNWFFGLMTIIIISVALFEFYAMIEKKGVTTYKIFGLLLG